MNYEKLTVDRFAQNLKDGKYVNLTGARRAIGKTSSWDAKEKEKAQGLANKHFGSTETPKAAKASKKEAVAKTASVSKKQARKVAKKSATKTVESPAVEMSEEKPAIVRKTAPSMPSSSGANAPTGTSGTTLHDAVNMGRQVLTFLSEARGEYMAQKEINPSGNFVRLLTDMNDAQTRAVALVAITVPETERIDSLPPARVAIGPKATVAKNPPVPSTPAPRAPTPQAAPPSSPPALIEPAPVNGAAELTEEELTIANKIRTSQPATSISALPRPINHED